MLKHEALQEIILNLKCRAQKIIFIDSLADVGTCFCIVNLCVYAILMKLKWQVSSHTFTVGLEYLIIDQINYIQILYIYNKQVQNKYRVSIRSRKKCFPDLFYYHLYLAHSYEIYFSSCLSIFTTFFNGYISLSNH